MKPLGARQPVTTGSPLKIASSLSIQSSGSPGSNSNSYISSSTSSVPITSSSSSSISSSVPSYSTQNSDFDSDILSQLISQTQISNTSSSFSTPSNYSSLSTSTIPYTSSSISSSSSSNPITTSSPLQESYTKSLAARATKNSILSQATNIMNTNTSNIESNTIQIGIKKIGNQKSNPNPSLPSYILPSSLNNNASSNIPLMSNFEHPIFDSTKPPPSNSPLYLDWLAASFSTQSGLYITFRPSPYSELPPSADTELKEGKGQCARVGPLSLCRCGHTLENHAKIGEEINEDNNEEQNIVDNNNIKKYKKLKLKKGFLKPPKCNIKNCSCNSYQYSPSHPEECGQWWLKQRKGFNIDDWRKVCLLILFMFTHCLSFSHIFSFFNFLSTFFFSLFLTLLLINFYFLTFNHRESILNHMNMLVFVVILN